MPLFGENVEKKEDSAESTTAGISQQDLNVFEKSIKKSFEEHDDLSIVEDLAEGIQEIFYEPFSDLKKIGRDEQSKVLRNLHGKKARKIAQETGIDSSRIRGRKQLISNTKTNDFLIKVGDVIGLIEHIRKFFDSDHRDLAEGLYRVGEYVFREHADELTSSILTVCFAASAEVTIPLYVIKKCAGKQIDQYIISPIWDTVEEHTKPFVRSQLIRMGISRNDGTPPPTTSISLPNEHDFHQKESAVPQQILVASHTENDAKITQKATSINIDFESSDPDQKIVLNFNSFSALSQFLQKPTYLMLPDSLFEFNEPFTFSIEKNQLTTTVKNVELADILHFDDFLKLEANSFDFARPPVFYNPRENRSFTYSIDLIDLENSNGHDNILRVTADNQCPHVGGTLFKTTATGSLIFAPTVSLSIPFELSTQLAAQAFRFTLGGLAVSIFAKGIYEIIKSHRIDALPARERHWHHYKESYEKLINAVDEKFCWDNYNLHHISEKWPELRAERCREMGYVLDALIRDHAGDAENLFLLGAMRYAVAQQDFKSIKEFRNNPNDVANNLYQTIHTNIYEAFKKADQIKIGEYVSQLFHYFSHEPTTYITAANVQIGKNNKTAITYLEQAKKIAKTDAQIQLIRQLKFEASLDDAIKNTDGSGYLSFKQSVLSEEGMSSLKSILTDDQLRQCNYILYKNEPHNIEDALRISSFIKNKDIADFQLIAQLCFHKLQLIVNQPIVDADISKTCALDCIKAANSIIEKDGTEIDAYLMKGYAHLVNEELDEAITSFNFVLDLKKSGAKDLSEAHFLLASINHRYNDIHSAIEHTEKGLALDPLAHQQKKKLGNLYLRQNKISQAMAQYQSYLSLFPDDSEACTALSFLHIHRSDLASARREIEKTKTALKQSKINARETEIIFSYDNQLQELVQLSKSIDNYERSAITADVIKIASRVISYGLRRYGNISEGEKTELHRAANILASAFDLATSILLPVHLNRAQNSISEKHGFKSDKNSWDVLNNKALWIHSIATLSQILKEFTIFDDAMGNFADYALLASSVTSTIQQTQEAWNLLKFFYDTDAGGPIPEPITFTTRIVGNSINSLIRSRKFNRQVMFEHPAAYMLSDGAKWLALIAGTVGGLNLITQGKLLTLAKPLMLKLIALTKGLLPFMSTPLGFLVVIVTAVVVGYAAHKSYEYLYEHYQGEVRDALIHNAQLLLAIAESDTTTAFEKRQLGQLEEAISLETRAHEAKEEAIQKLKKVLESEPKDDSAKDDIKKAKNILNQVDVLDLFESGNFTETLFNCVAIIHSLSDSDDFYRLLIAKSCLRLEKPWLAERVLNTISEENINAHIQLGNIAQSIYQNQHGALTHFTKAQTKIKEKLEKTNKELESVKAKKIAGSLADTAYNLAKEHPNKAAIVGVNKSTFSFHDQEEQLTKIKENLESQSSEIDHVISETKKVIQAQHDNLSGEIAAQLVTTLCSLSYSFIELLQQPNTVSSINISMAQIKKSEKSLELVKHIQKKNQLLTDYNKKRAIPYTRSSATLFSSSKNTPRIQKKHSVVVNVIHFSQFS